MSRNTGPGHRIGAVRGRQPQPVRLIDRPGHYAIGLRDGGSEWHIGTTLHRECERCRSEAMYPSRIVAAVSPPLTPFRVIDALIAGGFIDPNLDELAAEHVRPLFEAASPDRSPESALDVDILRRAEHVVACDCPGDDSQGCHLRRWAATERAQRVASEYARIASLAAAYVRTALAAETEPPAR